MLLLVKRKFLDELSDQNKLAVSFQALHLIASAMSAHLNQTTLAALDLSESVTLPLK